MCKLRIKLAITNTYFTDSTDFISSELKAFFEPQYHSDQFAQEYN
jgi:hypothetical protein